jgi:hypothetical protein
MLSFVRRAVDDYGMIEEGDRIAVGISGGKDSLTLLETLAALRVFYPKKFEIVADKRAVDYMVTAGYNPVGLITFIQKTSPQARQDFISHKNLTSKRLAIIYEYIFTKYPYYLLHNPYINSEAYQNFLLTSYKNRKMLEEKIMTGSKKAIKYE